MMQTKPGVIHIVPRTGVFKLALETGTPIVPVLTYGENELFPVIQNSGFRALNEWIYKRWKWIVPLPHINGIRNWLQLAEAPLPPIHSYAGKPIAVETCLHPTPRQIQDLRTR
jgi:2-acylglycerol O-acyltransferase 2